MSDFGNNIAEKTEFDFFATAEQPINAYKLSLNNNSFPNIKHIGFSITP